MEYNSLFSKSFTQNDRKKFGFTAFLGSLLVFLTFLTVFRPSFHHLPLLNLRVSTRTSLAKLLLEAGDTHQGLAAGDDHVIPQAGAGPASAPLEEFRHTQPNETTQPRTNKNLQVPNKQELTLKLVPSKPICNILEPRSDFCNINGDIRILGNSSTIFFSSHLLGVSAQNETWRIRPYARKGDSTAMGAVTELSVKASADNQAPRCTLNHSVPGVVFSTGGYAGNHFHDFADILVPLFVTSRQFDGEVQFLMTNVRSYWLSKYKTILSSLSRYEIVNLDREKEVHCFPRIIVGLYQFHNELRINPTKTPNGYSMKDFRSFLRSSYSLKKKKAIRLSNQKRRKPRLLIISRNRTRSFTNEADIVKMAKSLGFTVVIAEPGMGSLSKFAELVNSCDVMMGVHGAGLTNLVFLPTNAILIQIVPWGRLEWLCSYYFGEPATSMKLRYLEYKIREEESTLIQQYPLDHAVFRDPKSIHEKGWNAVKSIYLVKQNVKLDVGRFKGTLLEALGLLHHKE